MAQQTVPSTPTSKQSDFTVENHGSIFILRPLTPAANAWVEENLPTERLTFGGGVVVEWRFILSIIDGITSDGLVVSQ